MGCHRMESTPALTQAITFCPILRLSGMRLLPIQFWIRLAGNVIPLVDTYLPSDRIWWWLLLALARPTTCTRLGKKYQETDHEYRAVTYRAIVIFDFSDCITLGPPGFFFLSLPEDFKKEKCALNKMETTASYSLTEWSLKSYLSSLEVSGVW
jgi:hypothetical protein